MDGRLKAIPVNECVDEAGPGLSSTPTRGEVERKRVPTLAAAE